MSIGTKRCVQCNLLKDAEQFRIYTYAKRNETPGRYRICKDCEAINSQYKRALVILGDTNIDAGDPELQKARTVVSEIEELYDILEANGHRTPRKAKPKPAMLDKVMQMKQQFAVTNKMPVTSTVPVCDAAMPEELEQWLNAEPEIWTLGGISPEYLQETIYESLKAKYRPRVGTDKDTFLPIYDDTYKDILNKILRKFDEYEEKYAEPE